MKKILTALFTGAVAATMLTAASLAAELTASDEAGLKSALESAQSGDTITVTGEFSIEEELVIGDGVSVIAPEVTGNFYAEADASICIKAEKAGLNAKGNLTFVGDNKVNSFSLGYYNRTLTIGEGASLETTGTGRVTVGWGNKFIIKGVINDASKADKEALVPSLAIPGGISITGTGASFDVDDAYIQLGLSTSKQDTATDAFDFSFENSIVDFSNNFSFATSTNGKTPTFNITFKDSIINLAKNFDLSSAACDVVIDNSDVTVGSSFRNDGKLDILNNSTFTVASQIQAGEHGGISGIVTVDDSTLVINCSTAGHAVDGSNTGVIIAQNGATVDIDYIKDTAVVIYDDATVETSENGLIGSTTVITNPVAKTGTTYYADLKDAFKNVTAENNVVEILENVTITENWDCRDYGSTPCYGKFYVPVTINGNGHTLKFTGTVNDDNHDAVFRFENDATVKNLTFDLSEITEDTKFRAISSKADLTVEKCTFIGNGSTDNTRAIIYGEGAGTAVGEVDVEITECKFIGWRRGITDNENGQDVKTVVVDECEFSDASVYLSATDVIEFTDNEVTGGDVDISANSSVTELEVTATGNTLDESRKNIIKDGKITADEGFTLPVAFIGANGYTSINEAITAAQNDDEIVLFCDITTTEIIYVDGKNITINLNGYTLTPAANKQGQGQAKGNILLNQSNLTIENGKMNLSGVVASKPYAIMTVGNNSKIKLDSVTVEGDNFDDGYSVFYICGSGIVGVEIVNSEINLVNDNKNFGGVFKAEPKSEGVYSVVTIDNSAVSLTGVTRGFVNTDVVITNGSEVSVTDSNYAFNSCSEVEISGENTVLTIEGCDDEDGAIRLDSNDTFTVKEGATVKAIGNKTYDFSFEGTKEAVVKVESGAKLMYDTDNLDGDAENFVTDGGTIVNAAEEISLVFRKVAEDNSSWKLLLVADNSEVINRLNSADFTFVLETDNAADAMAYEIEATNSEVEINNVNNDSNRYEFHFAGKDNTVTDTALEIELGTVTFNGYGAFTFKVDTENVAENTNVAHATTLKDNVVDTFIIGGDVENGENKLSVNTNISDELVGIIDSEILVPTRDLVINIDFPNTINNNAAAYQDMTVTVSGGDLEEALVVELGEDGTITDLTVYATKTSEDKDVTAEFTDGAYVVTVTDLLNVNTAYNVEVSGAGYRTARYTVTMTDNKTLNFWNNVKDNAVEVEENKASSAKNVTFLAGDIVKDSIINIYDLSAVVSYFGEIDLNVDGTENEYAKYDLNRDGKIDSKDVAYVLVSWNN